MTRPSFIASGILAAGLLAGACGGSDDAASDAATDSTTTTTDPLAAGGGSTPTTSAAPETTAAPETAAAPDTTAAPATTEAPDEGDCLVGNWVITEAEMNSYFDVLAAAVDPGVGGEFDFDAVGQTFVSFDGSNYEYVADFDLILNVGGIEGVGASSGTVSGTYTVADGIVTLQLTDSSLVVEVTVAGQTLSGSDLANGLLEDVPLNGAPIDCAGPTVGFQVGADPSVRHPVLLTPA